MAAAAKERAAGDDGARSAGTNETEGDPPDAELLPLDVTFEILKNRRRRLVLEYLRDAEETTSIGELAEHIAAIENGTDVSQLNSQQRKRVYIGLYQCHLPKMDDASVVEFNQDRGLVELRNNAAPLYDYLDANDEEEPDGDFRLYALLTAVFGGGLLLAQLSNAQMMANVVTVGFFAAVLCVAYFDTRVA